MIKIICDRDSYEYEPYTLNSTFELDDDADTTEATDMFVKVLELEGYQRKAIAHGLYEICNEICDELNITMDEMTEFYNKISEGLNNFSKEKIDDKLESN